MVVQTRQMEQELQVAPTLTTLPNELLYMIFDHIKETDLIALACLSRGLNHVATRHLLGPWDEIPNKYSEFGSFATGASSTFSALRYLALALQKPYIPSMTLMFTLDFMGDLDNVLRYHRTKYYMEYHAF
ncbi:uncharacterized protein BT62DRAFT_1012063 [Guyanagaster necrorhizus]|uniref:F-box domain-containing protein n=1 Tax=Guyanagaster necrorhizus TaxID=856835 RepID=A0A9P7VJD3_9AGAR|nr:uncharacterized protein BT62DRAFT_1012063 [Guyanagaster necrorhizus MCA 3950]KAG7441029.1 hypothetical protein BT62DRAFT_1012063 [Guyanagaster necrorhizus MCA 3950]